MYTDCFTPVCTCVISVLTLAAARQGTKTLTGTRGTDYVPKVFGLICLGNESRLCIVVDFKAGQNAREYLEQFLPCAVKDTSLPPPLPPHSPPPPVVISPLVSVTVTLETSAGESV